jgi:hypothetical protein
MCSISKQCGNVAHQRNATYQWQHSISKQCGNVAYQSNAAYLSDVAM